ncbi:MAG: hypothetical protein K8I82_08660, partial [Anaerolineae bacterium]|nr:hypothetical protein [Anaerolineae bacterium]
MQKLVLLVFILLLCFPGMVNAENQPPAPVLYPNQGHPACAGVTRETLSTPECEGFMASRPAPAFERVPLDYGLAAGVQLIRYAKNQVSVYDAPNGNRIDTLTTGYQYTALLSLVEGWAQIGDGRWVSMEDAHI